MGNRFFRQEIDIEKAKELYGTGLSQKEVAEELGTTEKIIYHRFREIDFVGRPTNGSGELNGNWRGDDAGYAAFHYRIYKSRGKASCCEQCGESDPAKKYEWANLTGDYANPLDYKSMCQKCHIEYDRYGRIK